MIIHSRQSRHCWVWTYVYYDFGVFEITVYPQKNKFGKRLWATMTGWWFGISSMFPYIEIYVCIGNSHPDWLSYFSEGLFYHQPGGKAISAKGITRDCTMYPSQCVVVCLALVPIKWMVRVLLFSFRGWLCEFIWASLICHVFIYIHTL